MNRSTCAGLASLLISLCAATPLRAQELPRTPAVTTAIIFPAAANAVHHGAKAPADEYFGRLKLSILGVRNTIADADVRADTAAADAAQNLCHKLTLAEDALRDWHAKYPDDSWIPKLGYALLKAYEKLDAVIATDDFRDASIHAIDLSGWLEATYPNSEFAPR